MKCKRNRSVIHKKSLILFLFLFCFLLSNSGCGKKEVPEVVTGYELGDVYHWENGPMKEWTVSDVRESFEADCEITWQSAPIVFNEGFLQTVVVKNAKGDTESYYCIYSAGTENWTKFSSAEEYTTADNNVRFNLRGCFTSYSGQLYAWAGIGEERAGYVPCGAEGFRDIMYPEDNLMEKLRQWEGNVYLTGDDSWYLYKNIGTYISENLEENRAVVQYMETSDTGTEQSEQFNVDGWILGVTGAENTEIRYYGMNHSGVPEMWNERGQTVNACFPENFSNREYAAVYAGNGKLILFDKYGLWESGEKEATLLYSFTENGYRFRKVFGMARGEGNTLWLLAQMDDQKVLFQYDLSKSSLQNERQEIVLAIPMQNVALSSVVADFNRHSSSYYVTLAFPEGKESREQFLTRIQMELSAGKGPDLLEEGVLYDVDTVREKGFLKSLEGYGFENMNCLESALETGRTDGTLWGIPYEFTLDFAAYHASAIGKADNIDIKALMNMVERSGVKKLDLYDGPLQIVYKYGLYDESNTDYIDWKKGKSKLTGEKFLKLLEFAGQYGHCREDVSTLKQQDVFASHPFNGTFTFYSFTEMQKELGEYKILGYPREEGNGIYMSTSRIYVNSRSTKDAGCIGFLQYLISSRGQAVYVSYDITDDARNRRDAGGFFVNQQAMFPVNREVIELMIEKEDGNNAKNQFVMDSGKILYLTPPISETQKDEFWYLVEHALPAKFRIEKLKSIVEEELEPYFDGHTTVEEAARKLNSRIQMYLDEQ